MRRYPPSTIYRYQDLPSIQRIRLLHPHRVPIQPNIQTKDHHMTTQTRPARPSSESERNLIVLQVNINIIKNKLEKLELLIHNTHAKIITIQETKLTIEAKTPKEHNFTIVRVDRMHKAGGGLNSLIRYNITFIKTDTPSMINTHYIEPQMVKLYINNTKHITIVNIYIYTSSRQHIHTLRIS